MSINYNTTLKNARLNLVTAAIDAGGGSNAGYLQIADATGFTGVHILVTIPFDIPSTGSFGAASGGVITANGTPLSATAANTGTATQAEVFAYGGAVIISGLTVGTSGADINLSSTSIVAGQSCTITAASITHG
jgi:hypothetical protein